MSLSPEMELFRDSPRMFLSLLSVRYFNQVILAGGDNVDRMAATVEIAIRAMGGGNAVAVLFDHPYLSVSNAAKCLASDYITVTAGVQIFENTNLRPTRAADILSASELPLVKARDIILGLTANRAQSILYAATDRGYYSWLVNLMTYGASNVTISSSTTITGGVNRYGSLTINSGVTLTVNSAPRIILANTITNNGTITTTDSVSGGTPGTSGAGAGGVGRGGIIIVANNIAVGSVLTNGGAGGNGTTVTTTASGGAGTGGILWEISGYPAGTGGGGGQGGAGSKNAGGGGGGYYVNGGAGGAATVTTFSTAQALLSELFKILCDWWLVNVAGKTPTSTKSLPDLKGSGGGGGGATDGYAAGGGGGGGGGQIIIYGTSVTAGTVQANGGNGGNGGTEGTHDGGGGGGGGGLIYVFYKSLSGSFSFSVAGGAGGTGDYPGGAGTSGSAVAFAV